MAKKLWHKRDEETSKQYKAFQCYYLLDPAVRSIRAAVAEYNRDAGRDTSSNSQFEYWSAQHDWVARAESRDDHKFKLRDEASLRGTERGAEEAAVNLEYMRKELADRFEAIGEGADNLLQKVFEKPEEFGVKLSEINGLQRTRLDIYRALSKNEKGGDKDKDPLAALNDLLGD